MRGVEAGQPGRDPGQRLPLRRAQHLRHLLQLVLARREKMKKSSPLKHLDGYKHPDLRLDPIEAEQS